MSARTSIVLRSPWAKRRAGRVDADREVRPFEDRALDLSADNLRYRLAMYCTNLAVLLYAPCGLATVRLFHCEKRDRSAHAAHVPVR